MILTKDQIGDIYNALRMTRNIYDEERTTTQQSWDYFGDSLVLIGDRGHSIDISEEEFDSATKLLNDISDRHECWREDTAYNRFISDLCNNINQYNRTCGRS